MGNCAGKILVILCAVIMISATISITIFLGTKGLQSFIKNGVSLIEFITSTHWNPTNQAKPEYGALPFIFGSFAVTFLAAISGSTTWDWRSDFYDRNCTLMGKKDFTACH